MSDAVLEDDAILAKEDNAVAENIKALVAGGVGGVAAVLTGHPFDLLKVRCQNGQAKNTVDAIKLILAEHTGSRLSIAKSFYRGVIPPLVGVTPIFAISFWGYDVGKRLVSTSSSSSSLSVSQLAAAGFISAIPTTLATTPIERVKVILQTSSNKNILQVVRKLGLRSLYKGSVATLARDGPGSALYFATYELVKTSLNKNQENGKDVNVINVCVAGGMAGIAMWTGVFPIDTIKTKLQASSNKDTMIGVMKLIYAARGFKGFFPGLGPALLRSFPANAATFLGVELTHSLFKKYNI